MKIIKIYSEDLLEILPQLLNYNYSLLIVKILKIFNKMKIKKINNKIINLHFLIIYFAAVTEMKNHIYKNELLFFYIL